MCPIHPNSWCILNWNSCTKVLVEVQRQGWKHCWKPSVLSTPLRELQSGEARLCCVQSPLDIKHHPRAAQNRGPQLSLSTASELPSSGWWTEFSCTPATPPLLLFGTCNCFSSPPKLENKVSKKKKIYRRAARKLPIVPFTHN